MTTTLARFGRPARIFVSYAHRDDSHRERLEAHLAALKREGLIATWHDRMIKEGSEWDAAIDHNLENADIVVLLISADFLNSNYCLKELALALARHDRGEAHIIPVFVEPTDYNKMPFAKLQGLPRNEKAVSLWPNMEEAWLEVAKGIRAVVETPGAASAAPTHAPSRNAPPADVSSVCITGNVRDSATVSVSANTVLSENWTPGGVPTPAPGKTSLCGVPTQLPAPSISPAGAPTPAGLFVIAPDEIFMRSRLFEDNPDRKCVGTVISIDHLCGSLGLPDGQIAVSEATRSWTYPPYATAEIESTTIDGRDGDKVALVGFEQRSLDMAKGLITLEVGFTKYSARVAMRKKHLRTLIEDDLARGTIRLVENSISIDAHEKPILPMQLHCDGLVITEDNKVVIARRGSGLVDIDGLQWAASFGESMEWNEDRNIAGKLHPIETVWRGLEEELGLPRTWVAERCDPSVTFMELGCQIDSLVYILFSVVRLPNIDIREALNRARNNRSDKESDAFHYVDFTPASCVAAIVDGVVGGRKLNCAGRFALLLAGLNLLEPQFSRELKRVRSPGQ